METLGSCALRYLTNELDVTRKEFCAAQKDLVRGTRGTLRSFNNLTLFHYFKYEHDSCTFCVEHSKTIHGKERKCVTPLTTVGRSRLFNSQRAVALSALAFGLGVLCRTKRATELRFLRTEYKVAPARLSFIVLCSPSYHTMPAYKLSYFPIKGIAEAHFFPVIFV